MPMTGTLSPSAADGIFRAQHLARLREPRGAAAAPARGRCSSAMAIGSQKIIGGSWLVTVRRG